MDRGLTDTVLFCKSILSEVSSRVVTRYLLAFTI